MLVYHLPTHLVPMLPFIPMFFSILPQMFPLYRNQSIDLQPKTLLRNGLNVLKKKKKKLKIDIISQERTCKKQHYI